MRRASMSCWMRVSRTLTRANSAATKKALAAINSKIMNTRNSTWVSIRLLILSPWKGRFSLPERVKGESDRRGLSANFCGGCESKQQTQRRPAETPNHRELSYRRPRITLRKQFSAAHRADRDFRETHDGQRQRQKQAAQAHFHYWRRNWLGDCHFDICGMGSRRQHC